jgi:hypothetical protein
MSNKIEELEPNLILEKQELNNSLKRSILYIFDSKILINRIF